MKVEILGYWGGYPVAGGATAGYLVSTNEGHILLDCGSGVMSKLSMNTQVHSLSGVILTHLHEDHIADLGVLQYALIGALRTKQMQHKLPVYSPSEPVELWNKIQSDATEHHVINRQETIFLAGAEIEFIPVQHTIPCYALRIRYQNKMIVYSADTSFIEPLISFAKDADLFICEATICAGSTHTVGKGHMDAKQAGMIAKEANVKSLVLTHLPHDGDFKLMHKEAAEVFHKNIYLANEQSSFTL